MQSSQVRVPVSTLIFFYFIRKHVRPQSINRIFIYITLIRKHGAVLQAWACLALVNISVKK